MAEDTKTEKLVARVHHNLLDCLIEEGEQIGEAYAVVVRSMLFDRYFNPQSHNFVKTRTAEKLNYALTGIPNTSRPSSPGRRSGIPIADEFAAPPDLHVVPESDTTRLTKRAARRRSDRAAAKASGK